MSLADPAARSIRRDLVRRGTIAAGSSVLANWVILLAVTATGAVQSFLALSYARVGVLTLLGVVGATVVYGILRARSTEPERTFAYVVVGVLVLSFVPDLTYARGLPGATLDGVVVLMAMHTVAAGVSYAVLTR